MELPFRSSLRFREINEDRKGRVGEEKPFFKSAILPTILAANSEVRSTFKAKLIKDRS
jgi:hypothetical protein